MPRHRLWAALLAAALALPALPGAAESPPDQPPPAAPGPSGQSGPDTSGPSTSGPGTPLTGEGFDALTRGRTMDTHDAAAGLYGVETFLPGRRVIWRDAEKCSRGTWEEVEGQICFTYELNDNNPVCWIYVDRGGWIEGWFQGDRSLTPIELHEGTAPVSCDGWLGT